MKNYFKRNINKISLIAVLLVAVLSLVSCRQGKWPTTVYTTWAAEWKLEGFFQIIFGWPVAILSYPIAWLMHGIGKICGNSYAWGLILTTIVVRTIAWPIYAKQNSSTIKMQLIQPEMEKIQRKYAGRKDPESQRRMQQETMSLYKKYKMNPLGCMFTMFLQFPIFMGMYEAVRRINLYQTTTVAGGGATIVTPGRFVLNNTKLFGFFELGVIDVNGTETAISFMNTSWSSPDKWFALVIAILFAGITLLSQKLSSRQPSYVKKRPNTTGNNDQMNKQMKFMNYFMIVMFFIMSLQNTSLALYWLVGGIYQLFQSFIGRKLNERNYYKMKNKMN